MALTQTRLKELLDYNPNTGIFTNKVTRSNRALIGAIFGTNTALGYKKGTLDGKPYLSHRLAWFYTTGSWPKVIDHINGIRHDNRLANLRDITQAQNMQNIRAPYSTNRSGILGVSTKGKRFVAKLTHNQSEFYLGTFDTPEEAHQVYLTAKRQYHSHNTL